MWYKEEAGWGIGRMQGLQYRMGSVRDRDEAGCGKGRK